MSDTPPPHDRQTGAQHGSGDAPQQAPVLRSPLDRLCFAWSTGLYSGLSPFAPGTAGSAVAAVLMAVAYYFVPGLRSPGATTVLALVVTATGIAAVDQLFRVGYFREEDPQIVVVDEFAGLIVTLIGHGDSMVWIPAAFLVFRAFDITKIFPANRAESLPGAWGVICDDIVAGMYGCAVLHAFRHLFAV